jgi:hypothetical protein
MALGSAVRAYIAHPDPRVAAGNLIALVVAWNQPFYPLYLYWVVGPDIGVSFLTLLSTPFFAAVPAVTRRHSLLGRALLPLTGIANTVLSAKAFGEASGVELFLAPCLTIAALLFRRAERAVMFALVGLGLAAYLGLHGRYGPPLHLYSAEEYSRFFGLNAFSVLTLSAFVGIAFAGAFADDAAGS